VDVANSVWGGTGELIFEGATADAIENEIRTADATVGVATFLLPDQAAAADIYPLVFSVLATNAFEAANSVWMDTNQVVWEGATADAFETLLVAEDADTGVHTFQLPDNNAAADTYMLMFSLLDTNALQLANSIWFDTNEMRFEGATADAFETVLVAQDADVGVHTFQLPDNAAAADTYNLMFSVLDTNALDVANSIWFETTGMWFEGATEDAFEVVLAAADSTVGVDTYQLPDRGLAAATYGVHASDNAYIATHDIMIPPFTEVATVAHTSDVNEDLYCHRYFVPDRVTIGSAAVWLEDGGALAAADIVGVGIYHDTDAAASQVSAGTGDGTAAGLEVVTMTAATLEPEMYRICICTSDATNMLFGAIAPAGIDNDFEAVMESGVPTWGVAAQTCTAGVTPTFTGAIAGDDDEPIFIKLY
jgi:hypothetical protein